MKSLQFYSSVRDIHAASMAEGLAKICVKKGAGDSIKVISAGTAAVGGLLRRLKLK